jgi:hypothetical protein
MSPQPQPRRLALATPRLKVTVPRLATPRLPGHRRGRPGRRGRGRGRLSPPSRRCDRAPAGRGGVRGRAARPGRGAQGARGRIARAGRRGGGGDRRNEAGV